MKPIVFYDFYLMDNNKVTIEKEKLDKLLEDVYNAGFEDGRRESRSWITNPPKYGEWAITCDSNIKRNPINGSLTNQTVNITDKI